MAKKFGKLLLATAAIGTAAACAYYYLQKKDAVLVTPAEADDDFDDFDDAKNSAPNYVPLTPQNVSSEETAADVPEEFDSLFAEIITEDNTSAESPVEENIEEFFNDNEFN